jgi:hypothetical protein
MHLKTALFMSLALLLVVLSGCDRDCCCSPESAKPSAAGPSVGAITASPKPVVPSLPQVSGTWVGRWESGGHPGHGGGLKCEAKEAGPQKWEAVFTAEFGQTQSYNVKLEGKPGDGKVLFGGSVDLGPGGGVFTWTGDANATEFNGKYSGGGDTGTFKMTRAK